MAGVAVAAVVALRHFGLGSHPLRMWMAVAVALLAASPWLLVQARYPLIVDINAKGKAVTFEFEAARYAWTFALCNREFVISTDIDTDP